MEPAEEIFEEPESEAGPEVVQQPKKVEIESSKNCNSCLANAKTNYCVECRQYYCKLCSKYHLNMNSSKGHTLLDMTSTEYVKNQKTFVFSNCKVHNKEPVDVFCVTCNAYSCPRCLVGSHKQHNFETIDKQFDNFFGKFSDKIELTSKGIKILEDTLKQHEVHFKELQANVDKEIKLITDKESEIKNLLRKYTVALIDNINANFSNYTKEHNDYANYVKECLNTLKKFKEQTETHLNHLNTKSIVTLPESTVTEPVPLTSCKPFLCKYNISFQTSGSTQGTFDGNIATMFGILNCTVEKDTPALVAERPEISLG